MRILSTVLLVAGAAAAQGIWRPLPEARTEARITGRPLLVYVYDKY